MSLSGNPKAALQAQLYDLLRQHEGAMASAELLFEEALAHLESTRRRTETLLRREHVSRCMPFHRQLLAIDEAQATAMAGRRVQ